LARLRAAEGKQGGGVVTGIVIVQANLHILLLAGGGMAGYLVGAAARPVAAKGSVSMLDCL